MPKAMQDKIETLNVDGSDMEVFVFEPSGAGPHPAIILAQHIPVGHTGIENDEFTLVTARRLADAGYLVAAPFIFHWWPKDEEMAVKARETRDERTVRDLTCTQEYLMDRGDVDRLGMVGHCWGGRVAWLGACHLKGLSACAVFYGGRIKLALGDGNPTAISLAPRISCPVAGFFGNDDANPTPEDVDDYETALIDAGVDYEFHRYEGAGHAFQNFPTPDRYRHEQSEDAWVRLLKFLETNLLSHLAS
jgi:carboxymethylenebutenolidase